MKKLLICLTFACFACTPEKKPDDSIGPSDTVRQKEEVIRYEDIRENLRLAVNDTIKRSRQFYFSDNGKKDLFLLTVEPGPVKDSRSGLKIYDSDNKLIYQQGFDTWYFVRYLFYDSDSTFSPRRIEACFQNNVEDFFSTIGYVKSLEELSSWKDEADKGFLEEVMTDSTIKLMEIPCYSCDEGVSIMGYSRKLSRVVPLLEHD